MARANCGKVPLRGDDEGAVNEAERLRADLVEARGQLKSLTERLRRSEAAFLLNEERLDALLALSERHESSVEELAQFAIDETVRLTGSAIGYLHFVNATEDGFLSYFWSARSRETCAAVEPMDYSIHTAGIWADTLRHKRPFVHNDYPNEPTRRGLPAGHHPLSRHMGAPVLRKGKVVAVCGVANRRALELFLDIQWKTAAREGFPVSLLMLDIDFFKAYNDAYGHQAGDEALKKVGQAIAGAARRPTDLAARYGGEEFVLVLARTEAEDAL